MISDEKMIHIVHLMLDGIRKQGLVDMPHPDEAVREAKKVCMHHLSALNEVGEIARRRILSQKNPPLEFTSQWENLYQKYFEEESKKRGG